MKILRQAPCVSAALRSREAPDHGDAVPVAEEVGTNDVQHVGFFSASEAGVLDYIASLSEQRFQLTWFDRSGKQLGTVGSIAAVQDWGRFEVYVQTFAVAGSKVHVSTCGGKGFAWSRDGKELFFTDGKMMAAAVRAGAKFEAGEPKALFDTGSGGSFSFNKSFDVSKDGRFPIPVRPEQAKAMPLTVVVNWTAALPK
jgi:hypothetical protein